MRNRVVFLAFSAVVAIILLIVVFGSVFVIDETEQAVVVRLGRPTRIIVGNRTPEELAEIQKSVDVYNKSSDTEVKLSTGAGLYFKTPFVDDVRIFDDRLLEYDSKPAPIVTSDKKQLRVDNFARWRISNPLLFLQKMKDETLAQSRLDDLVFSVLRENLSKADMIEIVRSSNRLREEHPELEIKEIREGFGRELIMGQVTTQVSGRLAEFGIEVLDVRIKRADLLAQNEVSVFDRMKAERKRISDQNRAEGQKELQKIQAEADREVEVLLAEARKKAEILLGEGDAEAAAIYAAAYEPHVEFYDFIRSLDALRASVGENTRLVISTDSPIFKYLKEAGK